MTDAPAIPVVKPRVRWPLSLIVGAVSLNTWAEARRGRIPPQPVP